ncbi:Oxysterol-binding protein-related protein 11 [Blattella germanica]|nr:Oxysterol-binding protein-related protein 11 [Blattella germanica]
MDSAKTPNEVHLQHEFSAVWPEPMPVSPPLSLLSTSEDGARATLQDDITDEDDIEDSSLVPFEEHKSIILHLLSQLKLGMDLTRVVLPTFILERRSLLEMFADCMGHPQLFICIPDETTPFSRMMALVEWYLTSFHVGRSDSIAKKPYNPIIGETFHCSWRVNTTANASLKTIAANGPHDPETSPKLKSSDLEYLLQSENGVQDTSETSEGTNNSVEITYTAEQVSHHPPGIYLVK